MIKWMDSSIRRKLMLSLIGIFIVTYALTAAVVLTSVRGSLQDTEAGALRQIASQKLGRVEAYFQSLATNVTAWTRLEVMNDIFSADIDKRISRTLAELHDQYALEGDVYVFDAEGFIVAASHPVDTELTIPDAWRLEAGDPLRFEGKGPMPLAGGADTGEIVALKAPIAARFGGKAPIGTLVATVPWHVVETIMAEDGLPTLLVSEETHTPLLAAHLPMPDTALPTDNAGLRALMLGGERYITGHADAATGSLTGWAVISAKPEATISAAITRVALQLLALGAALYVPIHFGIRWMARRLTDPVNTLEKTVSSITSARDLSLRANVQAGDEIGSLARAFNTMAESLQETSREREDVLERLEKLNLTLEKRVEERTAELSGANAQLQEAFEQLKTTQSQLVQSEKMASLGQLVAGVAHELNNPISFIYANFPHIEEYADEILALLDEIRHVPMPDDAKAVIEGKIDDHDIDLVREDLKKIVSSGMAGASRIKEIVLALRSFSRLDEAEKKSVSLEKGLDDTLAILNHFIKGGIEVEKDYGLSAPVDCHAGQINQVFTNIIFNAVQAMGESGKITLVTKRDGENAVIRIADTGPGIPEGVIERIFDPFFTTKKVGEGTGLGLSISYGIIEKHGGTLEVESTPGEGTTFTITLPIHAKDDDA
ncbi:ATP-binding protein [Kordiimonas lipolytica]|uniref:histidine kinase n=1 Tax=Kordiimonas lipolytica TaxID=1662421 RepID=A0ABV8U6T1_9PROT|nr:ATP-binding protein [Kordiimonas lipolytica]